MTLLRRFPVLRLPGLLLAIAVIYFAAARFGLSLAYDTRQVSAVWPPTGIAIAAMLLFGPRIWPAILVGAFFVNALAAEPLGTALGIAVGNTLEALMAGWLLRRAAGFGRTFTGAKDAFAFITLAALPAPVVSATIGATSLCLGGVVPWTSFGRVAALWWTGDALGALVVAPLILSWSASPPPRRIWPIAEAAALAAGLLLVSLLVFGRTADPNAPFRYAVFPFVLWSAYRFGMRGATTTTLVIAVVAIAGTIGATGAEPAGSIDDRLLLLQLFMAVVAIAGLVFGAMTAERNRAEQDLRGAYEQMEARVEERTADLARTNHTLTAVIEGHRHTLERLRLRDRQFAEAQALAHIGSWEWDMTTDTVTWSDELYRLYGLEPQSIRVDYAEFLNRVHEADRETIRASVGKAHTEGATFSHDHRVVWPDGSMHWLHGQGRVICDATSRAVAMAGTAQDISRRREHEDALQGARDELEIRVAERTDALQMANRTKDEFLATLAHELRNPLAPIRNAVEAMRLEEHREPRFAHFLAIVERQVENIVRLIDELLDISRVEHGKIELKVRPLDLSDTVRRAIETCAPLVREREHTLEMTFPGDPVLVAADPLRLEQVAVNLLTNAAKYTPDRGTIHLAVERTGEHALFRVRDNGVGIDPAILIHVFDLFVQAEQGLDRSRGGLGIGLTLVRRLVEMHGGTVSATSQGAGKGSEFVVTLPLAAMVAVPDPLGPGEAAPSVGPCNGRSQRVLVIEDHPDNRNSLAELLALAGHDVQVAADGPEGVRVALASSPEVVLIDIGLPGMDGYEVCAALARDLGAPARLIALTGYGDAESLNRAAAAGFDTVLAKPVSLARLARALDGHVENESGGPNGVC